MSIATPAGDVPLGAIITYLDSFTERKGRVVAIFDTPSGQAVHVLPLIHAGEVDPARFGGALSDALPSEMLLLWNSEKLLKPIAITGIFRLLGQADPLNPSTPFCHTAIISNGAADEALCALAELPRHPIDYHTGGRDVQAYEEARRQHPLMVILTIFIIFFFGEYSSPPLLTVPVFATLDGCIDSPRLPRRRFRELFKGSA